MEWSIPTDASRRQPTPVDWDYFFKSMLSALNAENAADMPAFVKVPALAGSVGRDENVCKSGAAICRRLNLSC